MIPTLAADWIVATAATVTGAAAVGVWREARRLVSTVDTNRERSAENHRRSVGNRRYLRAVDQPGDPAEHDPRGLRTDGGRDDG